VLEAVAEEGLPLPIDPPVSALGLTFIPLIAATLLVHREERLGVRRLLSRVFDQRRIRKRIWYVPIIFLMPLIYLLTYWVMRLARLPLPDEPYIPFLMIPILFVGYFIGAVGEEVGWMGYAVDPLQDRWSALATAIILGSVWAIWHYPALVLYGHALTWIAWWTLGTVAMRIIIVWLYNNTGRSLFGAIIFHAMSNIGLNVFPNWGSHYDPAVGGALTAITAVIVTFLWGRRHLLGIGMPERWEGTEALEYLEPL
jgi:membrane protease YdiL (CAAX protease family)